MRGIRVLLPMLVLPLIAAAQQTPATLGTPAAQLSLAAPRAMQPNDWHRVVQLTTPARSRPMESVSHLR